MIGKLKQALPNIINFLLFLDHAIGPGETVLNLKNNFSKAL